MIFECRRLVLAARFLPLMTALISALSIQGLALANSKSAAAQKDTAGLILDGRLIQGAMLFGQTLPGAKVSLLGRTISADQEGKFVFGLGRDAKPNLDIAVKYPDGSSSDHSFTVEQRKYLTQKIEGVAKKYVSPPKEVLERIKSDNARIWTARNTKDRSEYFRVQFSPPAYGSITGVYGSQRVFNGVPKRPHFGLDIAGPVGTPITAPAPGTVTLADADLYYSGGTVIIDHGQGISSTFIHLDKIHVKKGQFVEQGELIADMGATGRVTGPHLDWRINWYNQRLDPEFLIDRDAINKLVEENAE